MSGKPQKRKDTDDEKEPPPAPKKAVIYNAGTITRAVKRVLVTGGAGFLGSHLCDRLMEQGCEVVCCDNLYSGDKRNIAKWLGNPRFEFLRHDVTDPLNIQVDRIYHLACPASPVFYQKNGVDTLKTGFIGTMNMLELARRTGARFLITSTSEVYGSPQVHPQVEEYWGHVNPIGIRSCYDEGKRIAETLCIEFKRMYGVDVRIARVFNTYGPRMLENDGRVVSNFIVQALQGQRLTIYGEGLQTRSFCYCDDTINGLMKLMEGEHMGPINIGNPNERTVKDLAEMIQKMINPDVSVQLLPMPSDDPPRRQPDITKARKLLGWEPKWAIEDGLKKTIEYFTDLAEKAKLQTEKK